MSILRIDPDLLSLLTSDCFQDFTSLELREAFLRTSSPKAQNRKSARQFISRNILRLEKNGCLERVGNIKGSNARFRAAGKLLQLNGTHSSKQAAINRDDDSKVDVINSLKEKLNYHKLDMLSAIGETEEYEALSKELPQIKGVIQERYNQSRDRCSKILGRVRALESLITYHQNS